MLKFAVNNRELKSLKVKGKYDKSLQEVERHIKTFCGVRTEDNFATIVIDHQLSIGYRETQDKHLPSELVQTEATLLISQCPLSI